MKPALARRLAPLALLAVPLLALPAAASNGTAATSAALPAIARGVNFGTSMGTDPARTMKLFPNARVLRVFQSSPSTKLPYSSTHAQIWLSFENSPSQVASGRLNAQFAAALKAWNASGRTVYWTWRHEADRGIGITPTQFRAGWAQLLRVAARYPSSRVHSMSILTAYVLNSRHPHGNPESWYVPAQVLGFDAYFADNLTQAMYYAKSKHKQWALPEFGAHLGDARNVQFVRMYQQMWASYPPIGACWYNNTSSSAFSQPLSQIPLTTAFLRTLAG